MDEDGFDNWTPIIDTKIDEILERPNWALTRLEEFLDDDGFINELRKDNEKLISYLKLSKIKQLINYVIQMPQPNADYKTCYKYPFISSEILSLNNPFLLDYFFESIEDLEQEELSLSSDSDESSEQSSEYCISAINNQIAHEHGKITNTVNDKKQQRTIDYFFDFLETDCVHEPILIGYFCKIVISLLQKREFQTAQYIYTNERITNNLLANLQERSFAELLIKIILVDDSSLPTYIEEKYNILSIIFDKLLCFENEEVKVFCFINYKKVQTNCSLIISDIVIRYQLYGIGYTLFN